MKKTILNLTVNLGLLQGGLIMAFSGLLIQTQYHMECLNASEKVLGSVYSTWSVVHIFSAVFVAVMMIFHFAQHWRWYKIVVNKRLFAKNQQVLLLTLIFLIVVITGIILLSIDLCNGDQILRKKIIEVHDKIALILFAYLVFHVVKRFKWYFIILKKHFFP
jgi:hypothetical protein